MIWLILSGLFAISALSRIATDIAYTVVGLAIAVAIYLFKGKKYIEKRKSEKISVNKPHSLPIEIKFTVVSWGEYYDNITAWQSENAKDKWVNAEYSEKHLYHYAWMDNVYDVRLIPEPQNEYDRNAIAVYLSNYKAGYVPSGINIDLLPIIKNSPLTTASVHGGNFKYIDKTGNIVLERRNPVVEITIYTLKN